MLTLIVVLLLPSLSYSILISKWTIVNSNGSIKISNVSSPIDVYSCLYQNSIIQWPLADYNDELYRWIAYDNWTFISEPFFVPKSRIIELEISKLDVSPILYFNEYEVPATKSAFASKRISIDRRVVRFIQENIIRIVFTSPVLLANSTANSSHYKAPPACWPKEYRGECHVNYLRTTQASFAWDWGPAIPSVGIRGAVEVIVSNETVVKISNIKVVTKTVEACRNWSSLITAGVNIVNVKSTKFCVSASIEDLKYFRVQCQLTNRDDKLDIRFPVDLGEPSTQFKLWWPQELGTPALYELVVSLHLEESLVDQQTKFIGFRTISLNQSPVSESSGNMFEFIVNCKPVYLKGTNYIPRTYLTADWYKTDTVEYILYLARAANINAIRIWGGGSPELEMFYNVADNLGILIWHDLMFACSLYPVDEDYLETVSSEVQEIVSRLQYHPSLLVWAGNNEVEAAIAEGWYGNQPLKKNNIANYVLLFDKVVRASVERVMTGLPFLLSSPSNGKKTEADGGVSNNPQSVMYGDVHFYLYVGQALWNEDSYPVTRMTSEFGFQAFPSVLSWDSIAQSPRDYEVTGRLAQTRQHHPGGTEQIFEVLRLQFGQLYPTTAKGSRDRYIWFSYLSQINQAEILRAHINKLARFKCQLQNTNDSSTDSGFNRGAMYWQLNDVWVAPTWSTVDALGRWKLGHYFVSRLYSGPTRVFLSITGKSENQQLLVTVSLPEAETDSSSGYRKHRLVVSCLSVNSDTRNASRNRLDLGIVVLNSSCTTYTVFSVPLADFLATHCPHGLGAREVILRAALQTNDGAGSSDSTLVSRPAQLSLDPETAQDIINVASVVPNTPDLSTCRVTLTSQRARVHLYVMLEVTGVGPRGAFSENGFHMTSVNKTVIYQPWYPLAHSSSLLRFVNCTAIRVTAVSINALYS